MSLIHTCYRITDIDRSVAFYEALGFQEVRRAPIRDEAINVFMNQPEDGDNPRLELTFNHGRTEPYEIGTGYGHIAITADDLDQPLANLARQGIEPVAPYAAEAPQSCPMTTASLAPSASTSARASRASVSWSASRSGISVGWYPRMKGLTARYPFAAIRERRSSQVCAVSGNPCSISTNGPVPSSR